MSVLDVWASWLVEGIIELGKQSDEFRLRGTSYFHLSIPKAPRTARLK